MQMWKSIKKKLNCEISFGVVQKSAEGCNEHCYCFECITVVPKQTEEMEWAVVFKKKKMQKLKKKGIEQSKCCALKALKC